MNGTVSPEFAKTVGMLVQRRQDYLASLKSGSSMVKIMYQGKQLTCVYMRHTMETVSVKTTKETVDHVFNGATLCLSGPFTEVIVKFKLNEVQVSNS